MNKEDLKVGDEIYIRAVITKLPEHGERLIRCVTGRKEILWCEEKELIRRK